MRPWIFIAIITVSGLRSHAQQAGSAGGHHNQSSSTNNGTMIQNNYNVSPNLVRRLKALSKKYQGSDQGWLAVLTPDASAAPSNRCNFPADSLQFILGGGTVGRCAGDSCKIIVDDHVEPPDNALLEVKRVKGVLFVNAKVFDSSGRIVATLDQSRPHINKNNAFDWSRPDDHEVDVVDQRNTRVLHIRFLNSRAIYVEGTFYNSIGGSLEINSENIRVDAPPNIINISAKNECFGGVSGGAYSF